MSDTISGAELNDRIARVTAYSTRSDVEVPLDEFPPVSVPRGPAGVVRYYNSAQDADQKATVFDLTGVYNVKEYGAKGDGVTDDLAAIQAAVNAVGPTTGGGVVYFPPGRYRVSGPIEITKHCTTLRGTVLGQNNSIGTEIVGFKNHDVVRATTNISFITMENIGFAHDAGTHTSASTLLTLRTVANGLIRNCKFANIWNGVLIDGCNQVSIENCEIRNSLATSGVSYGLRTSDVSGDCLGIHIRGLRLFGINNTAGSVGLDIAGAATIYVSQCPITKWDIGAQFGKDSVTGTGTGFIRLNQCEFENCGAGILASATTRFYAVDCQVALSVSTSGWRFTSADVGQISLVGCMAVNNQHHGYFLDGCGSASFSIVGCVASGNSQATVNTFSGLTISNTNNVTVVGGRYGGSGANSLPTVATQFNGIRNQGGGNTGISIVSANLEGNNAAFLNGATQAPLVLGCRGYEDVFRQARASAQANNLVLKSGNAGVGASVETEGSDADVDLYLTPKGAGRVVANKAVVLPTYTVAGVPAAAGHARGLIYVSNEAGGAVVAFSDGTNWRRVTDRAIVS